MPLGVAALEGLAQGLGLVVDHHIQAALIPQPARLVVGTSGSDHSATLDPGDLGGGGADRAGGGGDEHLLPVLQGADVQQTTIGGEAGAPESMHIDAERHGGVGIKPGEALASGEEIFSKTLAVVHQIALGEGGVARLDDPADRAAAHGFVQLLTGSQARSHGRIDRHVEIAHQHLALGGLGDGGGDQGEVLFAGHASRPVDQVDLLAFDAHGCFLLADGRPPPYP